VVGEPEPGTRIYRRKGADTEMAGWYDAICNDIEAQLVSPGGVSMFAPVSRAAVYKRLREGRLTAFAFHVVEQKRGLFGRVRAVRQKTPYLFVPVSEARAWSTELKGRADRLTAMAEAQGEVADLDSGFLEHPGDRRGKRRR
jgi:hypothetical protein